jgi:hypothetical protein
MIDMQITADKALQMAADMINENPPGCLKSAVKPEIGGVTANYERIWATASFSLHVSMSMISGSNNNYRFKPKVNIGFSLTPRDVPAMVVFLKLAQEITELAALIESTLNQHEIIVHTE